jgi:hypothetical protein
MNDVVIKGKRINSTKVEWSVEACGAYDEVFVHGIDGNVIKNTKEVHQLFGVPQNVYVNTVKDGEARAAIKETKTVASTFSFLETANQPYIFDKTTGKEVHISLVGQDPHAIMMPNDFKWPREKVCIKNAYRKFNSWGANKIQDNDWFTYYNIDLVY